MEFLNRPIAQFTTGGTASQRCPGKRWNCGESEEPGTDRFLQQLRTMSARYAVGGICRLRLREPNRVAKWRLSRVKTPSDGFSVHLTASCAIFAKLRRWVGPKVVKEERFVRSVDVTNASSRARLTAVARARRQEFSQLPPTRTLSFATNKTHGSRACAPSSALRILYLSPDSLDLISNCKSQEVGK